MLGGRASGRPCGDGFCLMYVCVPACRRDSRTPTATACCSHGLLPFRSWPAAVRLACSPLATFRSFRSSLQAPHPGEIHGRVSARISTKINAVQLTTSARKHDIQKRETRRVGFPKPRTALNPPPAPPAPAPALPCARPLRRRSNALALALAKVPGSSCVTLYRA